MTGDYVGLRTSDLLLVAAASLRRLGAGDLAIELHVRAAKLRDVAAREQRSCGVVHAEGCELMGEIGEVHP